MTQYYQITCTVRVNKKSIAQEIEDEVLSLVSLHRGIDDHTVSFEKITAKKALENYIYPKTRRNPHA